VPALSTALRAALSPDRAAVGVRAASKREAIAALVDLLATAGKAPDRDALLAAVLEREALAPTGLGDDCAIPHAQTDAVAETSVAVVRLAEPVDFGAPDGSPARLLFLLAGPRDSAAVHLRLLSKLARLLSDPEFRRALLEAPDGVALAGLILDADEA